MCPYVGGMVGWCQCFKDVLLVFFAVSLKLLAPRPRSRRGHVYGIVGGNDSGKSRNLGNIGPRITSSSRESETVRINL